MKKYSWPLLFSLLLTLVFLLLESSHLIVFKNFDKLIDVSINIAGILLGFLITVQGILVSMGGSQIMIVLKDSNKLGELTDKLKVAIISAALLLCYSLFILVIDVPLMLEIKYFPVKHNVWFFLITLLTISSFRFVSLFVDIISHDN